MQFFGTATSFLIGCLLAFSSLTAVYAQTPEPIQQGARLRGDSLLPVVEVSAQLNPEFRPATKIQTFDSASLHQHVNQSLAELLQQKSLLTVREYGAGQLSSVSFRGTGSSHTAVLWNGFNINSLSLGMTDFSAVPLGALEQVEVIYGNGSPLYGSDALGGSVHLSTFSRQWRPGWQNQLQLSGGSFGRYEGNAKFKYATRKAYLAVSPYYREAENNFSYKTDSPRRPELTNENSASQQYGSTLSLGLRPSATEVVSLNIWGHHGWRQIQPTIQSTGYSGTRHEPDQHHRFLRTSLAYNQITATQEINAQLGYLYDDTQQYGRYNTRQLIAKGQYTYQLKPEIKWAVGGELNHREAININYTFSELWAAGYGHLNWQPKPGTELAASLRYATILGRPAQLVPSAETKLAIVKQRLNLVAKAGRHFRFPTLNDRYWPEVGVPNLQPEAGWQGEAGSQLLVPEWGLSLDARAFYMDITNWILWAPDLRGEWRPNNLQQVISRGLELETELSRGAWLFRAQGTYVRAVNKKIVPGIVEELDQQLAYTPKLRSNAQLSYAPKPGSQVFVGGEYTGLRYTGWRENERFSLPYFYLLHAGAGHTFRFSRHQVNLYGRVNNLLNHQYQSYGTWAMPGRHFQLSVTYSLTSP